MNGPPFSQMCTAHLRIWQWQVESLALMFMLMFFAFGGILGDADTMEDGG
jgi:hypothetical protein